MSTGMRNGLRASPMPTDDGLGTDCCAVVESLDGDSGMVAKLRLFWSEVIVEEGD
uniref:Uncharacterized protein n=1 Tax=Arundo donax TaxID=35708 RepID=A0A0A9G744_ARUDO